VCGVLAVSILAVFPKKAVYDTAFLAVVLPADLSIANLRLQTSSVNGLVPSALFGTHGRRRDERERAPGMDVPIECGSDDAERLADVRDGFGPVAVERLVLQFPLVTDLAPAASGR
jgi:hypothetical protein